jgi:hypothetical protein
MSLVSVVCCQVEVSCDGPITCLEESFQVRLSEFDLETTTRRKFRPMRAVDHEKKIKTGVLSNLYLAEKQPCCTVFHQLLLPAVIIFLNRFPCFSKHEIYFNFLRVMFL